MRKKELFQRTISWFRENMPIAETELHYLNNYQLLVAVILSAQCTDKRVNIITPPFFDRYPDPKSLASSTIEEIYDYIKSCSYPNNKAKNLSGMANTLLNDFGGIVPDDPEKLQSLPGVGRKTANVMLSVAFEKPALAVDTHVFRVAARIGLSVNSKTPFETEKQLVKYIPEDLLSIAHHWLILHGRYVCIARKPRCMDCGLRDICKYYKTSFQKS
jgi:endonuclease III